MLPTLAEVLALPEVQRGDPAVLAGAGRLHRAIRWVHVAELADIAPLLQGDELLLNTGILLPSTDRGLRQYVAGLAEVGLAGLAIELGRRFTDRLPDALVEAAEEHDLPLIAFRRETSFVAVTQAVHQIVVNAQMTELQASEEAHRAFTRLTLGRARPQQVVDLVAEMADRPVVFENLVHHVIAYNAAGRDHDAVIGDWERRSRSARMLGTDTAVDVGPEPGRFGRLVLLADGSDTATTPRQRMLLERGATALAMGRLIDRDAQNLELQAHRTLLTELAAGVDVPHLASRLTSLGLRWKGRHVTGLVVRLPGPGNADELRGVAADLLDELRVRRTSGLVGLVDDERVVALVAHAPGSADAVTDRLVERLARTGARLVVGVGSPVDDVAGAGGSVREALVVADSAAPTTPPRAVRLYDLRLRGLLHLLRSDPRVQQYVERELGTLLAHDARTGEQLTATLAAYCRTGGNKVRTAELCHISRPALYARLQRIGQVVDIDLADPENVLALHVALLAREVMSDQPRPQYS
ncbi:PucR family transcriptional regulator [Nocardioides daeguensis]|uniref:PucR family transcriptional regulator n=1 Tax=Nocardioides daeguensis TaxID=908359 RepID=A0ABP6WG37_9ACTN|nr:PucR family transcriptional regulator [Nocardioides daeguensis]MBV6727954.1 PucR family transcriptional regulator ligand-binding domain-containing protein [Nocardioides daeguensis]MCR1774028.1 PucR family transcriptional regulator ligand-binding domain-containing protein [Nocardioides daeguensis]